jgi:hypothetical protein
VRIAVAEAQLRDHQAATSIATLEEMVKLKILTKADAPRFFLTASYAYLELQNLEKARANFDRVGEYLKEERDKQEAQRLGSYLSQIEQARSRGAQVAAAPRVRSEEIRPAARPDTEAKVQTFPDTPSAEGTFEELLCEDKAKVVLKTAGGMMKFVIDDPQKIVVAGKEGGKADLNCGQQKPVPMKVEYDPAKPGSGYDGTVKVLYFK